MQVGNAQAGEYVRTLFRRDPGKAAALLGPLCEGLVSGSLRTLAAVRPDGEGPSAADCAAASADCSARITLALEACASELPQRPRSGSQAAWAAISVLPGEVSESALRAFVKADKDAGSGAPAQRLRERGAALLRALIADGLVDSAAALDALCPAPAPGNTQVLSPPLLAWAGAFAGGADGRPWLGEARTHNCDSVSRNRVAPLLHGTASAD